jgi:hypothetical protein
VIFISFPFNSQNAADIMSVLLAGLFASPYGESLSYQNEPSVIHCLESSLEKRAIRVHSLFDTIEYVWKDSNWLVQTFDVFVFLAFRPLDKIKSRF